MFVDTGRVGTYGERGAYRFLPRLTVVGTECVVTCRSEGVAFVRRAFATKYSHDDENDQHEHQEGNGQADVQREIGCSDGRWGGLGWGFISVFDNRKFFAGYEGWLAHASATVLTRDILSQAISSPVAGCGV